MLSALERRSRKMGWWWGSTRHTGYGTGQRQRRVITKESSHREPLLTARPGRVWDFSSPRNGRESL